MALVPILSQLNPVQNLTSYFFTIHFISSSHLRLGLPFKFSGKDFLCVLHLSHAFYMFAHLILLDFITLITFGKSLNYEGPHYALLSSLQPLPPTWVQILFSNTQSII